MIRLGENMSVNKIYKENSIETKINKNIKNIDNEYFSKNKPLRWNEAVGLLEVSKLLTDIIGFKEDNLESLLTYNTYLFHITYEWYLNQTYLKKDTSGLDFFELGEENIDMIDLYKDTMDRSDRFDYDYFYKGVLKALHRNNKHIKGLGKDPKKELLKYTKKC